MKTRCLVGSLLCTLALAGPVLAAPTEGLSFTAPEGFTGIPITYPGFEQAIGVVAKSGQPAPALGDAYICVIGFTFNEDHTGETQAKINERFASDAGKASVREGAAKAYRLNSDQNFTLGDVVGIEILGVPFAGPAADRITVSLSLADAPRGRMVMSCAVAIGDTVQAVPVFRQLRSAITINR